MSTRTRSRTLTPTTSRTKSPFPTLSTGASPRPLTAAATPTKGLLSPAAIPATIAEVSFSLAGGTPADAVDEGLLLTIRREVATSGGMNADETWRVRIASVCEKTTRWCKDFTSRARRLQAAPLPLPPGQLYEWVYNIVVNLDTSVAPLSGAIPAPAAFATALSAALSSTTVTSFSQTINYFSTSTGIPVSDIATAVAATVVRTAYVMPTVDGQDRFSKWFGLAVGLGAAASFIIIALVIHSRKQALLKEANAQAKVGNEPTIVAV